MEEEYLDASKWAQMTYGSVMFSDQRRTQRTVQIAAAFARNPMGSLRAQMISPAATKAAYRLLECPKVTDEQLMRPHLQQARIQTQSLGRVLLIQDTTKFNYDHHPHTTGLGPVGPGNRAQGALLQTVLAVCPDTLEVLGIAAQEPFLRLPAPKGETSKQREKREQRESLVWQQQAQAIGAVISFPSCGSAKI